MSETSLQKGGELTLTVTDLNNLGCGVAHLPDGRAVFAAGAVAGDVVRAQLIKVNKTFAVARVTGIVTPSADREEGFCAASVSCGGCVYRHLTYERELELKREYVRHAFRKAGVGDIEVEPVRTTGETRGYRNKAEYPVTGSKKGLYGGFYAQKTHRVVAADCCALSPAFFGDILREICRFFGEKGVAAYDEETGKGLLRHVFLRYGKGSGEVMVCLVVNGESLPAEAEFVETLTRKFPALTSVLVNTNRKNTNLVLGERYRTLWGKSDLYDVLCGLSFRVSPAAFYQVNHDAAELLYGIAAERAALTGKELLLDLYCGAGTIGLSMANRVREVIGIEIVPEAVACARENAARNGIGNASFYCGDAATAEALLAPAEAERGRISPDVVVLDPPRKGCDAALLDFLAARRVPRIVYVSCGPDSLARDVAHLRALGYVADRVTPVDLFPRTGHVESVVLLTRIGSENAGSLPKR